MLNCVRNIVRYIRRPKLIHCIFYTILSVIYSILDGICYFIEYTRSDVLDTSYSILKNMIDWKINRGNYLPTSFCYYSIDALVFPCVRKSIEYTERRTKSINKISELQQEIENLKSEIDTTKLQQMIVDKKISNAITHQEKLKADVADAKLKRDNLSVEMVDLQQESTKRKEEKLLAWDAIKRACKIYKEYLDISIQFIENDNYERIKVSFFVNDDNTRDKYYVYLNHSDNQWKVEQIQPILKMEELNDFKGIIDFSNQSEISNVITFVCKLRHIFVKHYLNTEQ